MCVCARVRILRNATCVKNSYYCFYREIHNSTISIILFIKVIFLLVFEVTSKEFPEGYLESNISLGDPPGWSSG